MSVFKSDSQSPLVLMMQSASVYVSGISFNDERVFLGCFYGSVLISSLLMISHLFMCSCMCLCVGVWVGTYYIITKSAHPRAETLNLPFNSNWHRLILIMIMYRLIPSFNLCLSNADFMQIYMNEFLILWHCFPEIILTNQVFITECAESR